MADEEPYFRPRSPPYPPPDYIATTPPGTPPEYNETHPFLPEQEYGDLEVISTYDFIYFVQDYTPFLRNYLDYLYDERYITADDHGYYNSFIDICNNIDTDEGDNGTFETYREQVEPLMEWMTEECGHMNEYYEEEMRNAKEAAVQHNYTHAPKGVANRTRSKSSASGFEIPQSKRGRNAMTLEPIKQEGVRIKLSDGKEYTYGEIKHMWNWNKTTTPYRHPYTEEDKQKILDLINFATTGGKKTKKNKRKAKKRTSKRKTRKNKTTKTKIHKKRI
jgi:hypothetical protein